MSIGTFDLVGSPLEGRNLVEASAGTGKTFALAALFVRLLVEARLTVDRILVVTFTEAATEELRDRIRRRLQEALRAFRSGETEDALFLRLLDTTSNAEEARLRLAEALRCFDEAPILTIHGFCQRVLQEKAFECGEPFDAELVADERPLLREVFDDFWRREVFGASPALVGHLRRRKVHPDALLRKLPRWVRTADLRVLPEDPCGGSAGAENRCVNAREAVRRLWCSARDEVHDLLLNHPSLGRNRYPVKSVPNWVAEMDALLASSDPLLDFEHLEKFCPAALEIAVKKGHSPPSHPLFDACQELEARRRELEAQLDAEVLALQTRLVAYARAELPRRKAERNVRSFDDLLRAVGSALTGPGGPRVAASLRERYHAALIDEFQDTDPVQYGIFRTVFADERCRLFLIGDPKQAIYGFRGADVFAYLDAVSHVDRHWTLGDNWRSTPGLIDAVNTLFSNAPCAFVFPEIPFHRVKAADRKDRLRLFLEGRADESPLQVWFAERPGDKTISSSDAEETLPQAVAGEILRLLKAGAAGEARLEGRPVEPGDIAVLVRTNRQARRMRAALQERGVPGVLYGSESLFQSQEAEELLRVLSAVVEPGSERRIRAALVTDLLGVSGDELAGLDDDEPSWESRLQRFARYRELWIDRGFVVMVRSLLSAERVRERLLPLPDGERRLTNVLHTVEVLQRAGAEQKLGPEGLVRWLGRRLEERAEAEEYEIRLETDEKAVKIVTVHKSKGLEYPIVFCPFSWGGSRDKGDSVLYHDPSEPLRVVLDLGSTDLSEHRGLGEREALAENLRLLYVALTRAQNRCYLVWGAFSGADTSGLAHLLNPAPPGDPTLAAEEVDALAVRASRLTDAEMLEQLHALSLASRGAIQVSHVPPPAPRGTRYVPPESFTDELHLRTFERGIPRATAVASFSSLVSGREESVELPDRDEWDSHVVASGVARGELPRTFFAFPKGSRAGTCLHEMLEDLDYDAEPLRREILAREKLERHGFEAAWAPVVGDALGHILHTPLEPRTGGLTLADVPRAERINELEFYLPSGLLTARGLARVFASHGGPSVPPALPEALEDLGFRPTRGYLKGFIDLVFQSGGRYFLADWKSNHLGDRYEDYTTENLRRAVDEHLYGLQYHLYAAALHRHLGTRLPDYDFDRHFGGVFYVFLRGVDPARPGSGVHRARPTRDFVEAFCAYLDGGREP